MSAFKDVVGIAGPYNLPYSVVVCAEQWKLSTDTPLYFQLFDIII